MDGLMLTIHWTTVVCFILTLFVVITTIQSLPRENSQYGWSDVLVYFIVLLLNLVALLAIWLAYFIYW